MKITSIIPALTLALFLGAGLAAPSAGQCILANPSFEIGGQGGAVFGGWEQFGSLGSVPEATHGARAARVSGPNSGSWDMSGFYQVLDCDAGEQWEITGHVRHPAGSPLTGECVALVNVEWWNASSQRIDFESFVVADASTPTDSYREFSLLSTAAPAGTVSIILVLAVLQSPSDPTPDVHFDQITCFSTTPPTMDDLQWTDFPGGRSVEFAERSWRVKGPGYYGPGPNNFCHLPSCVWVDDLDRLHLTIKYTNASWQSTEVVLEEALGYGDYIFTAVGALDQLDVRAVLGLFIWQYGPCWDWSYLWWNPFNEIDVEVSRWGTPGNDIAQFVVQPYDWSGNLSRFDASFGPEELSSYAFNWLPDRVEFRAWRGGPAEESPETLIHQWTYAGPHIPRPEQPRVHMNLWQFDGPPATEQEVIIDGFSFLAAGATDVQEQPATPLVDPGRLWPATPNPFNPSTTIRYALLRDGKAELAVYDIGGARLRTLVSEFVTAGEHVTAWDGRDGAGRAMASGVYLAVLRSGNFKTAQRMVLIK